jgi:hypothetical protein
MYLTGMPLGTALLVSWFGIAFPIYLGMHYLMPYLLRQQAQLRDAAQQPLLRDAEADGTRKQAPHDRAKDHPARILYTRDGVVAWLSAAGVGGLIIQPFIRPLVDLLMDLTGMSFGASWMFTTGLWFFPLWAGMNYLFRRESRLRDAEAKNSPPGKVAPAHRLRFRTCVLFGVLSCYGIVVSASVPLLQSAGYDLWDKSTRYLTLLIGFMIGALLGASVRALRPQAVPPLLAGCASVVLVSLAMTWDWWIIRFFMRHGWDMFRADWSNLLIVPFIILLGPTVFVALLFGQIGLALAGSVGLVGGQLLGAFLGGALTAVLLPMQYRLVFSASPVLSRRRSWSGPLLALGMTIASLLWFSFSDGPTRFALRRVEHLPHHLSVAFSPDGRFAVLVRPSGEIQLWNVETGKVERSLEGRAEKGNAFALSADGRKGLASLDGTVRLWDVETGQQLPRFTGDKACQLAVSPDGRLALAAGERHWLGVMSACELVLHVPLVNMFRSDVARELKKLAGSENNTIKIWDLNTGAEVGRLRGHTNLVTSVAFSPDGRRALSGSFDGTMRLWDVAKQEEIHLFQGHTGWVTCVAFCPDGRRAIAGYNDWSVRLWDLKSRQELQRFAGHHAPISSLAVSPDGRSFLSGSFDCTMRLWDLDGGVQRCVFRGDKLPIQSVSFTAGGQLAVSWSMGGTIRLWEPKE